MCEASPKFSLLGRGIHAQTNVLLLMLSVMAGPLMLALNGITREALMVSQVRSLLNPRLATMRGDAVRDGVRWRSDHGSLRLISPARACRSPSFRLR